MCLSVKLELDAYRVGMFRAPALAFIYRGYAGFEDGNGLNSEQYANEFFCINEIN